MEARGITPALNLNKDFIEVDEKQATYHIKAIFHGLGNNYLVVNYYNHLTKKWEKAKFGGKLWLKAKKKLEEVFKLEMPVLNDNIDL